MADRRALKAAAWAGIGILFLVAAARAWRAIRRRDVATHREWMLRAFAVMFAVPLTRVLGTPIDIALVNRVPLEAGFVVDLGLSWLLMIGAAEWYIRRARARRPAAEAHALAQASRP